MNWSALKNYKCPKCAAILSNTPLTEVHKCSKCDFAIGYKKFDEIVAQKYSKTPHITDEERHADWNNYGREKRSEDFSDSRFLNY